MDFKTTIELIIKDIENLKELVNDFNNYPEIPSLQVEIAKSKCNNAIEILRLVEEGMKADDIMTIISGTRTSGNGDITEPDPKLPEDTEELVEESEKEVFPDIGEEIMETPEDTGYISKKTEKVSKQTAPVFGDTFHPNPNSIYDKIGKQNPSEQYKGKKTTNLNDIIGLNDRFLFTREIFNDDTEMYRTAINRLNNTNSFEDAKTIILEYVDSEEDEAYSILCDLVKRKFNING